MTVLFLIITIILFVGIDWIVRRIRAGRTVPLAPMIPVADQPSLQTTTPIRTPQGIFFARSHTWLNLFPSGKVRLGLDDFVGRLLDRPEITFLKREGEHVKRGEPILVLLEGSRSLTVRAPLDGVVLTRNEELARNPSLLKEHLFSDGWVYAIKPDRPSDLREMLFGEETRAWMRDEFLRLRDVFAGTGADEKVIPALLQDGGAPMAGALKQMDEQVWKRFEESFLSIQ
jgi:glycine cleavage system H lipoate-binding protein